jgi:hypothetical protein
MKTVKLISFHPEVTAQAVLLRQPGVTIDSAPLVRSSAVVGEMASLNPAALVLDLDKLPSHAREIAFALRASKSARHIPILFAGSLPARDGLPEKFARLRAELPDIPYVEWSKARSALGRMLEEPATAPPTVPAPRVYTATLAQKLGIVSRAATAEPKPKQIALVAAPDGFTELLGDLPVTVSFASRVGGKTDLALCFIRSLTDLESTLEMLTLQLPLAASAWIAYPKRAANKHLDFNENHVRNLCLAANFVDYKICSIDTSWSALKFAHRRKS